MVSSFYQRLQKIEQVQRRATKIIVGLKDLRYEDRLEECNLLSLQDRRKRGDLIETFKIVRWIEGINESTFWQPASSIYSKKGHNHKFRKDRSRVEIRKKFFSQRVVNSWNSLPHYIIDASSTNNFKHQLDKHMQGDQINSTFYPVGCLIVATQVHLSKFR